MVHHQFIFFIVVLYVCNFYLYLHVRIVCYVAIVLYTKLRMVILSHKTATHES